MTCIVATKFVDESRKIRVMMGADSASVEASWLTQGERDDKKIFAAGGFIVGYTTSYRMGQLLQYGSAVMPTERAKRRWLRKPAAVSARRLDQLEYNTYWSDVIPFPACGHPWMVTQFVPWMLELLKAGKWATEDKGRVEVGQFLIANDNRLFMVHTDGQVIDVPLFEACGCGEQFARGAMIALHPKVEHHKVLDREAAQRLLTHALMAANYWSAGVREPFHYMTTG